MWSVVWPKNIYACVRSTILTNLNWDSRNDGRMLHSFNGIKLQMAYFWLGSWLSNKWMRFFLSRISNVVLLYFINQKKKDIEVFPYLSKDSEIVSDYSNSYRDFAFFCNFVYLLYENQDFKKRGSFPLAAMSSRENHDSRKERRRSKSRSEHYCYVCWRVFFLPTLKT